jgi:glucokinase-like ROK family protein
MSGLTKAAVSSIVHDLIGARLVREVAAASPATEDATTPEIGRPGINLEMDPAAGYLLSVQIGVGFVSLLAADFALHVVAQRTAETQPGASVDDVLALVTALIKTASGPLAREGRPVLGLAIGAPGMVDTTAGVLIFAPNLGWRDVPLRDRLRRTFDAPITVANDANLAALGESYLQPGSESNSLVYVSAGIGVGGGIVLNGGLLTGALGFTGEMGHMTVDPGGQQCACGNIGCWETVANERALFRYARELRAERYPTRLKDVEHLSIEALVEAAAVRDRLALAALTRVGRWLGLGIANLINIYSPQRVVLAGRMAVAHEVLLPVIRSEVLQRALPGVRDGVQIERATTLGDATLMGGLAALHKQIMEQPMRWIAGA